MGDRAGMIVESPQAQPAQPEPAPVEAPAKKGGAWFPSQENVVIAWPDVGDLLQEELD